jgi:hypothetical protein
MKIILLIFSSIIFCSCVGTIEDTRVEITEVVADAVNYENYIGIDEAIAISHHQVEVYFQEVDNIQSDKVAYQIYYDGAEIPIFIPGNSLSLRADGRMMFTVDNLAPNREYYFEVQVTNLITGEKSLSDEKRSAKTFSNRTASFEGVQNVMHQPGPDGLNFIKVSWSPAVRDSNGLIPLPSDAAKYEVSILSSTRQLSDFNNISLENEDRKVVYFNESVNFGVVGGLQSGMTYYVRVRAIHHEYYDNLSDEEYKHEENNKYVEITMLTNDSNTISFDQSLFFVTKGDGAEGLNSAKATWGYPAGGAYNHFRLYYKGISSELISLIDEDLINIRPDLIPCEMDLDDFLCRRFDFTENSANILDLTMNWRYYFILVVCLDESCQEYQLSDVQNIITVGEIADFTGYQSYEIGDSFDELSSLTINVTPPDLSSGILDSIIVYYDVDSGDGNYTALNPPEGFTQDELDSPLLLQPYNFVTDNKITLEGIDVRNLIASFLGQENPSSYYFKYSRYTSSDGEEDEDFNESTFVATPQLSIVTEPIVVKSCIFSPGFSKAEWKLPSSGIYTHFKLEVMKNDIIVDTIYLDDSADEFSSMNYYLDSGGVPGDSFDLIIRPIILFEDQVVDPIDHGISVTKVNCD